MMASSDRRDSLVESIEPLLKAHDGVHVAGITRIGLSYRFMFYLATPVKTSDVKLPTEILGNALVSTVLDPDWMEYSSFVPVRTNVFRRIYRWVLSLVTPVPKSRVISRLNDDASLREVLASESHLSTATDIVFYLYVPSKKDAYVCYGILWQKGYRARVASPLGELSGGESEERWSVISHLHAVPSPERIAEAGSLMEHLAEKCGGAYDGWEAAVVPRSASFRLA